jgi:hypothetical protein
MFSCPKEQKFMFDVIKGIFDTSPPVGMRLILRGRILEDNLPSRVQTCVRESGVTGFQQYSSDDHWMLLELEGKETVLKNLAEKIRLCTNSQYISAIGYEWIPHTGQYPGFRVRT